MPANPPSQPHDHHACIDRALAQADLICAERGARLTPLRRRVLELVWRDHAAVGAYDLLPELGAGAKPPTVYRALDFLIEHGLVHRLESLNAYVGCPEPARHHDGGFLICEACGRVDEFDTEEASGAIAARARQEGFRIRRQTVEVRGVCRACPAEARDP